MRGTKLNQVSLQDIPIRNFGGENVILTKERNLIFPVVLKTYSLNYPITNIIDGAVLNSVFVVVDKIVNTFHIKIFNLQTNTLISDTTTQTYAGFVIAGNKLYIFYNNNNVLIVDTLSLSTQTLTITVNNASQNIVKVKAINSQAFVLITSPPTTIHLNSIIDLLSLSSTNTDITSLTYSAQTLPTKDIGAIFYDKLLYVYGEDGTSVLSILTQDLVYIKTENVYYYKYLPIEPFKTFSVFGENLTLKNIYSNDILEIENKSEDLTFFVDLSQSFIYFANRYKYFGRFVFDVLTGNLYELGFTGESAENVIFDLHYRFSVKVIPQELSLLYKIGYKVDSIYSQQPIRFQIESKYNELYNTYSYNVDYKRNGFISNLKGDTFIVHILPKTYLRLLDLNFIFTIL